MAGRGAARNKEGVPICMFIDWRQLPSMTDGLDGSGAGYSCGKTDSRPQCGRFCQQAMPALVKRIRQTEKPLGVMREIVRIVELGGTILGPFAGAGTTMIAARLEGYPSVGSGFEAVVPDKPAPTAAARRFRFTVASRFP